MSQLRITHVATHTYAQVFKHIISQQDSELFSTHAILGSQTEMAYSFHSIRPYPAHCPDIIPDILKSIHQDVIQVYISICDADIIPMLAKYDTNPNNPIISRCVFHVNDWLDKFRTNTFRDVFNNCLGIITPSDPIRNQFDFVRNSYGRVITIPNKSPRRFIIDKPVQERTPTVSAVALAADVADNGGIGYRDYTFVQQMLADKYECPLHVYPTRVTRDILGTYDFVMHTLPYPLLLKALSKYPSGWAGASNDKHDINTCVTNKFWDYLAAGIAPILYRSNEMRYVADSLLPDNERPANDPTCHPYFDIESERDCNVTFIDLLESVKSVLRRIPKHRLSMDNHMPDYSNWLNTRIQQEGK